ncbi:GGDEF domain-containing protein [Sphingomonas oleivorans]|uniref:diguanylate cyclase n=1 Tax=Sphingomonas oleivorans TaxID=1735121 RepID=A0A2T5FYQ5_9SPHN|nr:GGDEF domain-containing protein [Sphingomonas oleivorans]PTQ11646.1 GGDEF domain-containing protein [Sphingomonas oleivorans]
MIEPLPAAHDWRLLYERIGTMLFENGLEPTPANYSLAHRYQAAEDSSFNHLVDRAIEAAGGLTAVAAAAIIAQRSVELSASDLARIIADAQDRLMQVSSLIERSDADVRAYGAALEDNAATLEAGTPPEQAVATLIALTRSMIAKTRTVEEHLRRTGDEICELRESLAEAQDRASRDPLTGLPNRRALDARLMAATEAAQRSEHPFTICICDIDHFKSFNDTYGHQIGDEVIKFVASALARDGDGRLFAARYGGEEFVLLFEGVDAITAGAEIDRIRTALAARELKITATGQALGRLTFSAGIAGLGPDESASAVLQRADQALYAAKRAGRNRVHIARAI